MSDNKLRFDRPEEAAMARVLAGNNGNAAGTILRLAWLAGLSREEITELAWKQVDLAGKTICLTDRQVPMTEELAACLTALWEERTTQAEWVVLSDRDRRKMPPQTVSRLARQALDREGLRQIRLADLRYDFILRQLTEHGWAYVSCISGLEVRSLQVHFSEYLPEKMEVNGGTRGLHLDAERLWKVLQAERHTTAGAALWLAWQAGLSGSELIALTWDQVDLRRNVIRLPDREVPLTSAVSRMLAEQRTEHSQTHVLLAEQTRKPLDLAKLSRLTRSALIRGGLEDVTLKDLERDHLRMGADQRLLEVAGSRGSLTCREAEELLGCSRNAAYYRLRRLAREKRLVLVGTRYYPAGAVVPPEEQETAVRAYVEREGVISRQDAVRLLGIGERQCSLVLKHLVERGVLRRTGQSYELNEISSNEGALR